MTRTFHLIVRCPFCVLRKWGFTMNFIQYIKQAWKAGTSGGTPLSPDRLNHIEDGIKNNNDMISELNNNTTTTYENAIITYAPALALVNIMPAKLTNTVAIRSWTTVATLPEEYRPSKTIKFPVTVYNPAGFVAYGQLTPNGALQIYSDTEIKVNQGQTYYNFTYFI
nr:MAG TPA: receptor binding protein [Bacteriophage sp.]